MIVRELLTRLGFQVDQGSLNKGERATERLKDRADKAAEAFRNIFAGLAGIAAIKSVVAIGDEMQSLQARVADLPQTVGDAGAAFDEIAQHARSTRTPLAAYLTLYTRIGHAAKDYIQDQKGLITVTDTISNALVVGGATTQEASSAAIQFAQALGSGVLQGEEFRAMAEAAPQYLDQLAVAMGIPREQLKKMASDGKLTSKAVIEATQKMAEYFERRAKKMPMTVGQALEDVKTRFSIMVQNMNRESMFITRIADTILAGFDKIEAGATWLGEKFNGMSNVIRFALIAIGVAATGWAAPFIAGAVAAVIAALPLILTIAGIALVLDDLYSWFKGGESAIGAFLGPFDVFSGKIKGAWQMLKDFAAWVKNSFWAVGDIIKGVFTLDTAAIQRGLAVMANTPWSANVGGQSPAQALTLPGSAQPRGIMSNTTVNLTVPPGTSPTDMQFFSDSAQKAFGAQNDSFARDLGAYAQ